MATPYLCERCGREVPEPALYCGQCGHKVGDLVKISWIKAFGALCLAVAAMGAGVAGTCFLWAGTELYKAPAPRQLAVLQLILAGVIVLVGVVLWYLFRGRRPS
jgi:DNA-directed RNA polymerase subunit RPC12/RpoP